MDNKAKKLAMDYFRKQGVYFDGIDILYKCRILQSCLYIISPVPYNGFRLELTYDSYLDEWYYNLYDKIIYVES